MAGKRPGTTFYVVSYDIPVDKRRNRVHKILTGFGEWVQYSVFECFLTRKEFLLLRAKLQRVIKPQEDQIRLYVLCEECVSRVEVVGAEKPQEKQVYVT